MAISREDYDSNREYFATLSAWYEKGFLKPRVKNVLDNLTRIGPRVLDLGTASGTFALELAQRGYHVVAVDYSSTALQSCLGHVRSEGLDEMVCCVQASVEALPFVSVSVDTAIAADIIEHLYHPRLFLAEIARVLKEQGLVVVETPNTEFLKLRGYQRIKGLAHRLLRLPESSVLTADAKETDDQYHVNLYTLPRLRRELEEACLRVVYLDTVGWWLDMRGFDQFANRLFNLPLLRRLLLRYKDTDMIAIAEKPTGKMVGAVSHCSGTKPESTELLVARELVVPKIAENTFWNLLATVTNLVFSIATSAIIARMLGPEQQGHYSYILWLASTLVVLIGLGLPGATVKYVSELLGRGNQAMARTVTTSALKFESILASIAMAVMLLITITLVAQSERSYVTIAAVSLIPLTLNGIIMSAIWGTQEYHTTAKVGLFISPIQFVLSLISLRLGLGLAGLVAVNLVGGLLSLGILSRALAKMWVGVQAEPRLPFELRRRIAKYCASLVVIALIDLVVWQRSEVLFLQWFSSAQQIAFYSLAFGLSQWAMRVPGIFSGVLLPAISERYGAMDQEGIGNIYSASVRYLGVITFPICLGSMVIARPLVEMLYGHAYLPMVPVLSIIMLSSAFGAIASSGSSVICSTENQSFIVKFGVPIAVLNIFLDFLLIPEHGAVGAAIANSACQILGVVVGFLYILRSLRLSIPFSSLLRISLAAGGTGAVAWLIIRFSSGIAGLLLAVGGGMLVYIVLITWLKVVEPEDVALLTRLTERLPRRFRLAYLHAVHWLER